MTLSNFVEGLLKSIIKWFPVIVMSGIVTLNSYYTSETREMCLRNSLAYFVQTYNTSLPMSTYQMQRKLVINEYTKEGSSLRKDVDEILIEKIGKTKNTHGILDMENTQYNKPENFTLSLITKIKKVKTGYYSFEYLTAVCEASTWKCQKPVVHVGNLYVQTTLPKTPRNPLGVTVLEYYDNRLQLVSLAVQSLLDLLQVLGQLYECIKTFNCSF